MSSMSKIWILGVRVWGRWLLFGIVFALVAYPVGWLGVLYANLWSDLSLVVRTGVVLAFLFALVPFVFFFTARWTGYLQKEDSVRFSNIVKQKKKKVTTQEAL